MKRYVILCAIILGMVAPATMAQEAVKKVAVYMTGNDVSESYKKVIGAKLVSAITATDEYAAVERTADFLAALSAEQDYQTSGEVRDSQIARLGQKFGVRYVAVADMSELFDEIFISARLINVESGLVENAFDTSGPVENMAQLTTLSMNIAKGLITESKLTVDKCSTQPKDLTLCAQVYGKTYYITPKEWSRISDKDKLDINKLGICLVMDKVNNKGIVVALNLEDDSQSTITQNCMDISTCNYIYKYKSAIAEAASHFGGDLSYYLKDRCWAVYAKINRFFTKKTKYSERQYNSVFSFNNGCIKDSRLGCSFYKIKIVSTF